MEDYRDRDVSEQTLRVLIEILKKEFSELETKLGDTGVGIQEFRERIREILKLMDSSFYGIRGLRRQINNIECLLQDPNFGIKEIKKEIKNIEDILEKRGIVLRDIRKDVADIERKLDSPTFGLAEIKSEVNAVLGVSDQIRSDVEGIKNAIFSPTFGLAEIKTELQQVLGIVAGEANTLTTGPVVADNSSCSLVVKIFNSTNAPINVRVDIFDIGTCPRTRVNTFTFLNVGARCSAARIFPAPPTQFQIDFVGAVTGVFAWTSTRSNPMNAALSCSNFIAANTFRHTELIPIII